MASISIEAARNSIAKYLARQVSLEGSLTHERYRHILRVADTCESLCERYGEERLKGRVAGLVHDLARDWPEEQLRKWCPGTEETEVVLLHGPAAARYARRELGLDDEDILAAVHHHTLGAPGLPRVGWILFVADYIEPERSHVSDDFRQKVVASSLDRAMIEIIEHSRERFGSLAEPTRAMYDELMGRTSSGATR